MFDPSEVIGGRVNRNHNLATIGGEVAMAYQDRTPWHMLGQRVKGDDRKSVDATLKASRTDFTVSLHKLYAANPDTTSESKWIEIPDRRAVLRDGENVYLGTVGAQYTPIQNREGFMVMQDAIDKFGVTIESMGAIGKGERVWMLARMQDVNVTVVDGDDVRGYLLITTAHDGTSSYIVRPTPVRVVCQNTLALALASGRNFIRLQHKRTQAAQLDVVKEMILQAHLMMEKTAQSYSDLARTQMNLQDLGAYIESAFPNTTPDEAPSTKLQERWATVAKLAFFGKGADMAGAQPALGTTTAWAAYNAITEYLDHVRPAEAKADSAKLKANESAIFGAGDAVKMDALKRALSLVAAA